MKKILILSLVLVGIISLFFAGCKQVKQEVSSVLHEDAVVVDVVYSPSNHGSSVGPTIDFDGNIGLAFTSVSVPEKYAVVFKCQHGKFIIEGTDDEHKKLWKKLTQGDSVDVSYKEIYKSTYDDVNKDKKKELVSRDLIDYDFLDANKK